MMNLSCFSAWFLGFLLLSGVIAQITIDPKNYITWDDMKVGDHMTLHLRNEDKSSNKIIVVDQNGRGNSLTVQGAVDMVPVHNSQRIKIYILPGIYREKVFVPASKPYISFIGAENRSSETVITWHDKACDKNEKGAARGTFNSATVRVESDYFVASGITFENTVRAVGGGVNGYQAVAFRIKGNKAMFHRVRFLGSQDTLLDEAGTHYFYQCFIQGTTDFIFGYAKSLYQDCLLHIVKDGFAIAAHHRNYANEDTGFSFLNCTVEGNGKVFLGRAWGPYSRIIYAYCYFADIIRPGGWDDFSRHSRDGTVEFGEYMCRGDGSERSRRVPWSKELSFQEAVPYLGTQFINGKQWLRL